MVKIKNINKKQKKIDDLNHSDNKDDIGPTEKRVLGSLDICSRDMKYDFYFSFSTEINLK